jgi:hypothetical protein
VTLIIRYNVAQARLSSRPDLDDVVTRGVVIVRMSLFLKMGFSSFLMVTVTVDWNSQGRGMIREYSCSWGAEQDCIQ